MSTACLRPRLRSASLASAAVAAIGAWSWPLLAAQDATPAAAMTAPAATSLQFESQHEVSVGGRPLKVRAVAATTLVRDAKGEADAEFFGFSYFAAEGGPPARRPSAAPVRLSPALTLTRASLESASNRSRSSPSNPFITDRITINAATPTATPISETQVMNDTKNFRVRERT